MIDGPPRKRLRNCGPSRAEQAAGRHGQRCWSVCCARGGAPCGRRRRDDGEERPRDDALVRPCAYAITSACSLDRQPNSDRVVGRHGTSWSRRRGVVALMRRCMLFRVRSTAVVTFQWCHVIFPSQLNCGLGGMGVTLSACMVKSRRSEKKIKMCILREQNR